jgi:excisionase family DNA binding protein
MIELNGENYLTGHEASHLLGVKISTLYTYVSRGVLKSYKQGIKRQRLYKQAELESLLQLRPSDELASSSQGLKARQKVELPHVEEWMSNA